MAQLELRTAISPVVRVEFRTPQPDCSFSLNPFSLST